MTRASMNEATRNHTRVALAAAMAINSGALVAALSQVRPFADLGMLDAIGDAFLFWACGLAAGALGWLFAIVAHACAARDFRRLETDATGVATILFAGSVATFLIGCWITGAAFRGA